MSLSFLQTFIEYNVSLFVRDRSSAGDPDRYDAGPAPNKVLRDTESRADQHGSTLPSRTSSRRGC